MSKLVIVESPAKAKTIGTYLGKDYVVKATMGHIRDLPKSGKGVDVDNDFALDYQTISGKEKTIAELRQAADSADTVYLATDPDREGEAISWHLKEVLGLDDSRTKRVTFNEITKKEVQSSIDKPRSIDYQLVDAQQARRALDRLVGYEVSPVLWRKIRRGLSAGRVQSVACRLVVDREEEIRAFVPEEYWSIEAQLSRTAGAGTFAAQYFGPQGGKRRELKNEAEAQAVLDDVTSSPFKVVSVTHSERKRSPAPPFTTSTLQQEASRKLGMAPRRTMSVAQVLYEGVAIDGHGMTGLITYMRTDSLRLSDDSVAEARGHIGAVYGKQFVPKSPRIYKSKAGAQDAHEAIRPSTVELPPDAVKKSLTPEQFKLYKLIWDRFISCQMENAVFDLLTIDSLSAGHIFRANHTTVKFPGFTAVYEEGSDSESDDKNPSLPDLSEGEALRLDKIEPEQHFTKPPARYSEAALIRAMEEKGIGRPSTYAPTISTILDREYVEREGKQLRPTILGETVTGYMKEKFSDIVDVEFTAHMEEDLDKIEDGEMDWKSMLRGFYGEFNDTVRQAAEDKNWVKIPDEKTGYVCDVCGRPMVIKYGRFGRYMACEGYPDECKYTRPVSEETPGLCPLCGAKILKKKSKRGYAYFGCEKNPTCQFMTWDTPQPDTCESCGKTLFKNRKVPNLFCQNPECPQFLPEDQRGYRKKAEKAEKTEDGISAKKAPAKKTTAKKTAAKKTAAKKTTTEKTATKKTATTKTAAKKTAAAKTPAASKSTTKKPAAKKNAASAEGVDS